MKSHSLVASRYQRVTEREPIRNVEREMLDAEVHFLYGRISVNTDWGCSMQSEVTNEFVHQFLVNRHTSIEPMLTGRKGIRYDWEDLLIPSDAVIEAYLEMLLNAHDAGDSSPIASA